MIFDAVSEDRVCPEAIHARQYTLFPLSCSRYELSLAAIVWRGALILPGRTHAFTVTADDGVSTAADGISTAADDPSEVSSESPFEVEPQLGSSPPDIVPWWLLTLSQI